MVVMCGGIGAWNIHVEEWASPHRTNIDQLTLACGSDHSLVKTGGWTTRKLADGGSSARRFRWAAA
jgi:hypothetical protein